MVLSISLARPTRFRPPVTPEPQKLISLGKFLCSNRYPK
jgi:hypothetical protein